MTCRLSRTSDACSVLRALLEGMMFTRHINVLMTDLLHCAGWCESNAKYLLVERSRFNNRLQESDESIDAYTTTLCMLETCDFGSLKEALIRVHLVCGIRDNSVRKNFSRNQN